MSSPSFDGSTYQARFDALAAGGVDVHGEAAFVATFAPRSVLDAGCGTGRVAIELARRGMHVVGTDVDHSMITEAQRLAPELTWIEADLTELSLDRTFDVVVMAGNVPLFARPGTQPALVVSCIRHLAPGGSLIAGFQLGRGYELADYDDACVSAGAQLAERWSTWDGEPFISGSDYAVSVHRG